MCLFACSLTPPKRAADTVELKLGGMISLGVQMVLGQKLPDSTNGTLENKKNTYDTGNNHPYHLISTPPPAKNNNTTMVLWNLENHPFKIISTLVRCVVLNLSY